MVVSRPMNWTISWSFCGNEGAVTSRGPDACRALPSCERGPSLQFRTQQRPCWNHGRILRHRQAGLLPETLIAGHRSVRCETLFPRLGLSFQDLPVGATGRPMPAGAVASCAGICTLCQIQQQGMFPCTAGLFFVQLRARESIVILGHPFAGICTVALPDGTAIIMGGPNRARANFAATNPGSRFWSARSSIGG